MALSSTVDRSNGGTASQRNRNKKRWTAREKIILLALIIAIAGSHFRTFVKVNKQLLSIVSGGADDSPQQQKEQDRDSPRQPGEPTQSIDTPGQEKMEANPVKVKDTQQKGGRRQTKRAPTINDSASTDLEDFFYQNHKEQMEKLLLNESSFIVWDARAKRSPYLNLWKYFDNVYRRAKQDPNHEWASVNQTPYISEWSACTMARIFDEELKHNRAVPHVAFLKLNENWGAFSEEILNKTAIGWGKDLVGQWERVGCSKDFVMAYLDHPYTRAVITSQFQIIDHPKAHSLPLGLMDPRNARMLLPYQKLLTDKASDRNKTLMISHKPRPMRNVWVDRVIANFDGMVHNSFYKGKNKAQKEYYAEMLRSKFILSPGGLGFDCYRHYEALYLGTIPVIETLNRTDGWFRTLSDLPVAWIDSYDNLTPEYLETEYAKIVQKAKTYNYQKLTMHWWIDFIKSHLENVSTESLGPPPMLPDRRQSQSTKDKATGETTTKETGEPAKTEAGGIELQF